MADTYTPNLHLDKPSISAYDVFGAKINSNMDILDAASSSSNLDKVIIASDLSIVVSSVDGNIVYES